MRKFGQTSLIDFLIDRMPELHPSLRRQDSKFVDVKAAAHLYNIWKNKDNRIAEKTFKKPPTLSSRDLELMENEGLVKKDGEKLNITAKGSEIIKTMVLGDDRSIYEDDGKVVSYKQASANTRAASKMRKNTEKKVNDLWWGRF